MKEFVFGNEGEGIRVVVTSEGIEVSAWYDSGFGIEGGFIPWKELREASDEQQRENVGICGGIGAGLFSVAKEEC